MWDRATNINIHFQPSAAGFNNGTPAPFLLLAMASSQRLKRPHNDCHEGFFCRKQSHCPLFLEKKEHLYFLRRSGGGAEHYTLLSTLKVLVCNKEKIGVCCGESFELVNGNGRRQKA